MKIFVSWSGERSQALAVALREWLPLVLHYVEPWLSASDIKSGDRWSSEIAKELQASNFGIICVTRDNLEAPWLLFESGALAKSMEEGRVIPLRLDLDVSDISGPLTQFQSEKADEEGVRRLIESLNKASSNSISDDRLNKLFEPMWPQIRQKIEAIPASSSSQKKSRPQAEILEELVSGVRSVELRIRDISEDEAPHRRKSRRRMHPIMAMDIVRSISRRPDDPVLILIVASFFREEMPWLYELALEAYKAFQSGNTQNAKQSYSRFKEAINALRHSPMLEYIGADSKLIHMMFMDAAEILPPFEIMLEGRGSSPRKPLSMKNTSTE